MNKQLAEDEKQKRADYIIRNDDNTLIIPQVLYLHQRFLGLA
jgi:dephospho-CoA kinase